MINYFSIHMKPLLRIAFPILACLLCTVAAQSQISGVWHGILNAGGARIPLVIDVDKSTLDSPKQNAFGIPAQTSVAGDTLRFSVPAIGADYIGVKAGGKISGTFTQQGYKLPLVLEEGPYEAQRPQTPEPPYPYYTEEVEFVSPVDSARLSGTLSVPLMANMVGRGKIPAVVIVSGSGLQNRDGEMFGHKPYLVLAHHLANNGIASLRFDDRGFGKSSGEVADATTATFAADAGAAVDFLRSLSPAFRSVGVAGHSEGGTIAFMLASEGKADFIVSLAGGAVSGDSILLSQNRMLLKEAGVPEDQLSDYLTGLCRVFDAIKSGASPGIEAVAAGLPHLTPEMKQNYKAMADSANPWLAYFLRFNPAKAIEGCSCPVFALNGTLDKQVDAALNLGALRRLLPQNPQNAIKEYSGLNHLMKHASTGSPAEYGAIDETISQEVLDDIANWIKGLCN